MVLAVPVLPTTIGGGLVLLSESVGVVWCVMSSGSWTLNHGSSRGARIVSSSTSYSGALCEQALPSFSLSFPVLFEERGS